MSRRPRTLARALLVALLSVAIAVLGLGSMPAAQAAPKAQIGGTVTDAEGAGIKGIVVTALEYDGDDVGAFVADTTTKRDGAYTRSRTCRPRRTRWSSATTTAPTSTSTTTTSGTSRTPPMSRSPQARPSRTSTPSWSRRASSAAR